MEITLKKEVLLHCSQQMSLGNSDTCLEQGSAALKEQLTQQYGVTWHVILSTSNELRYHLPCYEAGSLLYLRDANSKRMNASQRLSLVLFKDSGNPLQTQLYWINKAHPVILILAFLFLLGYFVLRQYQCVLICSGLVECLEKDVQQDAVCEYWHRVTLAVAIVCLFFGMCLRMYKRVLKGKMK